MLPVASSEEANIRGIRKQRSNTKCDDLVVIDISSSSFFAGNVYMRMAYFDKKFHFSFLYLKRARCGKLNFVEPGITIQEDYYITVVNKLVSILWFT